VVWSKAYSYLDILNSLGVTHDCDGQTDGQTFWQQVPRLTTCCAWKSQSSLLVDSLSSLLQIGARSYIQPFFKILDPPLTYSLAFNKQR